jgi:hypothetical protein
LQQKYSPDYVGPSNISKKQRLSNENVHRIDLEVKVHEYEDDKRTHLFEEDEPCPPMEVLEMGVLEIEMAGSPIY